MMINKLAQYSVSLETKCFNAFFERRKRSRMLGSKNLGSKSLKILALGSKKLKK